MSVPVTQFDLLRHGDPQGGRRYRGCGVDDPLSEHGWQQMRQAAHRLASVNWDYIVSSPMTRCRLFAEELSAQRQIPLRIETDLREVGFGDWEGHTPAQIRARDPQSYHDFYQNPARHRPVGAEPLDAFQQRVVRVYRSLLEQHTGKKLLLVVHAGVIRAISGHVLEAPEHSWYRIKIDTGSLTRVQHDERGALLAYLNR